MFRKAFAVFLALHGIVHWIGFAVPWHLMTTKDNPYTTTVLWGSIDIGETGVKLVALLWLPAIVAFVVAAYGVWTRRTWATPVLAATAAGSLAICLLAMPVAVMGTVINVAILAGIAAAAVAPAVRRSAPKPAAQH